MDKSTEQLLIKHHYPTSHKEGQAIIGAPGTTGADAVRIYETTGERNARQTISDAAQAESYAAYAAYRAMLDSAEANNPAEDRPGIAYNMIRESLARNLALLRLEGSPVKRRRWWRKG